ncbi:MAG: mechanosensitive ion channel family protein [Microcystis wesenbergii TW10]|jgi:small conductance mechanosensitive channel|uniref:Small-conductance mechanosensitive channel n=4 Tax=Microcystis TaxID=1125 RepID=A0A0A1VVV3_MICAE|nr:MULTISPECIES: mechanosensitive ion channel family protein [Microcystis]MCZ8101856.1 mechanosensitive ion channel family protein [Burkholderiales bacterium]REJ46375.1 MAG: mechanosensitive ion channel family protein [Microcystis wesenbergii TW10]TRT85655.1 MAG: mechanosensitive ion channel family protein [Microcystis aeruginosa Ma_OC_H_19870700_S124]MCZ8040471.1 mechanosensitive ion channel family protein [Microcystis sp. LE17-20A]MCZ8213069.1 mechanosensitive ion channel family protein [Mic
MDPAQVSNQVYFIRDLAISFGAKLIGAIVLWFIGKWLINLAINLLKTSLAKGNVDPTIVRYIISFILIALQVVLIVAILGFFGVETTSFAALLAATGIAIGAAWGGLLANFAAGAFLVMFRPFKVGDFVSAAGITGTVEELGLFATTINTPDNIRTVVGNNSIFSGNIQNFSANPYRRVELTAQLSHGVNVPEAIALLKAKISRIPNVLTNPTPDVEILEFNPSGLLLAVRSYCSNDNYWQVYFDTNKVIYESFGEAGYPIPATHTVLHNQ